jgi:hypothetical protein
MGDGGERLYLASREVHQTHLNHYLTKYFPLSEEDKIHYLYECVENSGYRFMRNGIVYSGPDAMRWLRWKRTHPQYKHSPVLTANDFIERVADESKATGRPYEVILPDGRRQLLKMMLHNELVVLESATDNHALELAPVEQSMKEQESPTEVSYPPVAVSPAAS